MEKDCSALRPPAPVRLTSTARRCRGESFSHSEGSSSALVPPDADVAGSIATPAPLVAPDAISVKFAKGGGRQRREGCLRRHQAVASVGRRQVSSSADTTEWGGEQRGFDERRSGNAERREGNDGAR